MPNKFFTFSRFTLMVALSISAIAAWYSVLGLTAIFAAAVIPIIIMGSILEIAKVTTTVWLHMYWDRASIAIRTYLTIAVIALACLTSMGIFGLLSKAHLDQAVPSGDVAAKLALVEEKIKTQRDNIAVSRQALTQMDAQVDQRLSRGTSEQSAERAVQIRRQQASERATLQREINTAQQQIAKLNEERSPIASQLRKVESEVGPIKYFAALIYGDNPDTNTLERAVRWVIILIVVVFDPLAIVLILAANNSLKWDRDAYIVPEVIKEKIEIESDVGDDVESVIPGSVLSDDKINQINEDLAAQAIKEPDWVYTRAWTDRKVEALDAKSEDVIVNDIVAEVTPKDYNQSNYAVTYTILEPKLNTTLPEVTVSKEVISEEVISEEIIPGEVVTEWIPISQEIHPAENISTWPEEWVEVDEEQIAVPIVIETDGVTSEAKTNTDGMYVMYQGKNTSINALKHMRPDIIDSFFKNEILYGTEFPKVSRTGDLYTRIDVLPHCTFKFNGTKWIQVDKLQNTSYLQNIAYLQFLIQAIDKGEYDPELLTSVEQDEISAYLSRTA